MVFGNSNIDPDYHGLATDLAALSTSACCSDKAVYENIRIDDRVPETDTAGVSTKRANQFYLRWNSSSGSAGADQVLNALNQAGKAAAAEFSNPHLNDANLLPPMSSRGIEDFVLPEETEFVTVKPIRSTTTKGHLETWFVARMREECGDDLFGAPTDWADEVDEMIQKYSNEAEGHPNLWDGVIQAINADRQSRTYEKVSWAALRHEFDIHSSKGARFWLGLLGLGHFLYPLGRQGTPKRQWFIVLSYDASGTNAVARPTVLEAGESPWHYPTPASRPPSDGGRTMLLDIARKDPGATPITEFVHSDREFHTNNGWLVSQVELPVADENEGNRELEEARTSHSP